MNETKKIVLEDGIVLKIMKSTENIHVDVTVPTRVSSHDKKAGYTTSRLLNDLQEQGIKHGSMLEGQNNRLSNSRQGHELTGRWTFENPKTTIKKPATKTTRSKKKVSEPRKN